jgi:hypothetical protein
MTTPAPEKPNRTPATSGPARMLTFSIQLETTFVAVSSSGVRESEGVRAA